MRKWIVLSLFLCVGCKGVTGPFKRDRDPAKTTDPLISIEEQKRETRARLALPVDDGTTPRIGSERYGPTNR